MRFLPTLSSTERLTAGLSHTQLTGDECDQPANRRTIRPKLALHSALHPGIRLAVRLPCLSRFAQEIHPTISPGIHANAVPALFRRMPDICFLDVPRSAKRLRDQ